MFLSENPLCVMCKRQGKVKGSYIVDHIEPHRGNVDKFWAGPFQALCKECHDRHKKMEEQGGVAMGCDKEGYPLSGGHWWGK